MGAKRGRNRELTIERIKKVLKDYDHSFMSTTELVDHVPVSRPVVTDRLEELVERGEVETRKTSNMRIWWLAGRVATSPNERVVGDELVLDLDDRLREDLEAYAEEEDVTPERGAIDLLADALEPPPLPHWEDTKTLGFAFSLVFLAYMVAFETTTGIVRQAATAVAVIAMGIFLISFLVSVLTPVFSPIVDRVGEWRGTRS